MEVAARSSSTSEIGRPTSGAPLVSALEIFTIGIGPSSSHTVGPMRAAARFVQRLGDEGHLGAVRAVTVRLYGSLGLTGKGHGSDTAVILGLQGHTPEAVDPDTVAAILERCRTSRTLMLGDREVAFDANTDLVFDRAAALPFHPNGMRFTATDERGACIEERTYYSVGGGFVVPETGEGEGDDAPQRPPPAFDFSTAAELVEMAVAQGEPISGIMLANEAMWRPSAETRAGLLGVWRAMQQCIERGYRSEGMLPGALQVRRRAPELYRKLGARGAGDVGALGVMDWVDLYALAVNEENAAGGRVVTAPTNGAAGIIPSVLMYYRTFCPRADDQGVVAFLLTAAAIANLYKKNASLSGADVGCQGEVGVACSMAAGGAHGGAGR